MRFYDSFLAPVGFPGPARFRPDDGVVEGILQLIEARGIKNVVSSSEHSRRTDFISFTENYRIDWNSKRITQMNFLKRYFVEGSMTDSEFLQEFINSYGIPEMSPNADGWSYRDNRKGYQVEYNKSDKEITVTPVISKTSFD